MKREKMLYLNTVTSFAYQVIVFVIGFVLPRCILITFGSEINGLTTSISRFLGFISFAELGIGPVIQSNLYKPLLEKDERKINSVYKASKKFYGKIAYIFLIYVILLVFFYPKIIDGFDFVFTASLIIIISISTFVQYFFGISNQLLLNADQKTYITSVISSITLILNFVATVILINIGFSIHIVKLVSSIIFVFKVLFFEVYVKKYYKLNRVKNIVKAPLKQKWNGFYQHLAGIVCGETDVILLTLFHSTQIVSIYSVYSMVVMGITNLIISCASGIAAYWGNLYANDEISKLNKSFSKIEHIVHFVSTLLFSCCAILIEPFVRVYVLGLEDAEVYRKPQFGVLLSVAYAFQCIRIPYDRITKSVGHYKETQNAALVSMILNILISTLLVGEYGLNGVALGTLVAMAYHTMYLAYYNKKYILKRPYKIFAKHIIVDVLIFASIFALSTFLEFDSVTYFSWFLMAVKCVFIAIGVSLLFNFLFYRETFFALKYYVKKIKFKK